ncbi:histidine kinase N-terminal 7TM domain-containing protein [Haladaptatus sp. ZSTT2]|uniref:histidine kinase N-terminal 7TM domain-containing protein n=1 Tax=Haladaptatus sp. ZSTT2 TaxID=3120515 RepID=UPI00300EF618
MSLPLDLLVVMLTATIIGGIVAILAWRQRPEPGATALAILMAAASWWSLFYMLELNAATLAAKLLFARLQWFGSVTLSVAWVVFALEYTGNDDYVRPRNIALLAVIPAITLVLVWTNDWHHLIRHSVGIEQVGDMVVLTQSFGPWFWVMIGYTYILALVGDLLFIDLLENSPVIHRKQSVAILLAALAPWVGNLIFVGELLPWVAIDPTPVAFTVSGVASFGAISQYKLFKASPAPGQLARTFVLDEMADGVIVIDSMGTIVDINWSGATIVGEPALSLLGRQVQTVFPEYEKLSNVVDDESELITLGSKNDTRHYEVSRSNLCDHHERTIGQVLVFRDVTERFRYQQRLDVLNRVLRHNLRNEMNVVYGFADRLEEAGADAELTGRLKQKSLQLVDMGNKARAVQEIIETDSDDLPQISVASVIESTVRALEGRFPAVDVTIETLPPEGVTCGWVIEPTLENLLENAAEHNPEDHPTVTVSATVDADWLTISVADNGPGIPENEIAVLNAGQETSLMHSRGLGLWLVNWAVKALNGDLSFCENDPHGTVVTIRIPRSEVE